MGGGPRGDALQPGPVILIDTSSWVEFLRNTVTSVCNLVDELLSDEIALCDPVRMEVLAGKSNCSYLILHDGV